MNDSPADPDNTFRLDALAGEIVRLAGGYFITLCILLFMPLAAARKLKERTESNGRVSSLTFLSISAILASFCSAYFLKYQLIVSRLSDLTDLSLAVPPALAHWPSIILAIVAALAMVGFAVVCSRITGFLARSDPEHRREISAAMCYSVGGQAILAILFFILVVCAGTPTLPAKVMDVSLRTVFIYALALPPLVVLRAVYRNPAFKKSQTKAARSVSIVIISMLSTALCAEAAWLANGSLAEKLFPAPIPLHTRVCSGPSLIYNTNNLTLSVVAANTGDKPIILNSFPVWILSANGTTLNVPTNSANASDVILPMPLSPGESKILNFNAILPPEFNHVPVIESSLNWTFYDLGSGLTFQANTERVPSIQFVIPK